MTRDEAVRTLQSMKSDFPLPKAAQTRRAQNDALDVAIEVLKAESCDDAISRQAAIDAVDGKIEITGRTNAEAVKGYVRLVKDRLERLPSAQPDIIRCPDCYYNDGTAYCELHFRDVKADDFCSWAERRE